VLCCLACFAINIPLSGKSFINGSRLEPLNPLLAIGLYDKAVNTLFAQCIPVYSEAIKKPAKAGLFIYY
tara:strand:- start:106682 stop:106888 length:207 start_codon:yes stop_codon:yes gene_type:complete